MPEGALGCFYPCAFPVFPQPPGLGQPGSALRKQVVAGLLLYSPAPPTLVIYHLVDLVLEIWADRCVTRQELVIPTGDRLWRSSKELAAEPPSRGGRYLRRGPPGRSAVHRAAVRDRASVAPLGVCVINIFNLPHTDPAVFHRFFYIIVYPEPPSPTGALPQNHAEPSRHSGAIPFPFSPGPPVSLWAPCRNSAAASWHNMCPPQRPPTRQTQANRCFLLYFQPGRSVHPPGRFVCRTGRRSAEAGNRGRSQSDILNIQKPRNGELIVRIFSR